MKIIVITVRKQLAIYFRIIKLIILGYKAYLGVTLKTFEWNEKPLNGTKKRTSTVSRNGAAIFVSTETPQEDLGKHTIGKFWKLQTFTCTLFCQNK